MIVTPAKVRKWTHIGEIPDLILGDIARDDPYMTSAVLAAKELAAKGFISDSLIERLERAAGHHTRLRHVLNGLRDGKPTDVIAERLFEPIKQAVLRNVQEGV